MRWHERYPDLFEKAKSMYLSGEPLRVISDEVKISETAISYSFRLMGIPVGYNNKRSPKQKGWEEDKDKLDIALTMRRNGQIGKEIGKKLGITKQAVSQGFQRLAKKAANLD